MIDVIDAWLRLAADRLHEQAAALTALDQAIGDGDHGTNMDRGFSAIVALLDAGPPEGDDAAGRGRRRGCGRPGGRSSARSAARPGRCTAPRSCGPVGRSADSSPDAGAGAVIVAALDAAIGGIQQLGKAMPGEKTMLDALVPAVDAGRTARGGRTAMPRTSPRRWPRPPRPGRRHHPDARDEGPSVVSRRAIDRAPGSRGDVVGPAAARAGRRRPPAPR